MIYSFVDETIELKIKGRSRIDVQLDGNMILDGSEYDRQIKKIKDQRNGIPDNVALAKVLP